MVKVIRKNFDVTQLRIGDLVTYEIVKKIVSVTKPRLLISNYAQGGFGAEVKYIYDEINKKKRGVYYTFRPSAHYRGFWEYRGLCFAYESEQRYNSTKSIDVLEYVEPKEVIA